MPSVDSCDRKPRTRSRSGRLLLYFPPWTCVHVHIPSYHAELLGRAQPRASRITTNFDSSPKDLYMKLFFFEVERKPDGTLVFSNKTVNRINVRSMLDGLDMFYTDNTLLQETYTIVYMQTMS